MACRPWLCILQAYFVARKIKIDFHACLIRGKEQRIIHIAPYRISFLNDHNASCQAGLESGPLSFQVIEPDIECEYDSKAGNL